MQRTRTRRWALRFASGSALVAVLVLAWWLAACQIPRWRLERQIHRFEAAPSQTLANKLMTQLTEPAVTTEQGEHILRLLLKPKITTRESYPAGRPAGISMELPFSLESNAKMRLLRRIEDAPETPTPEHDRWTRVLATEPQILMIPPPSPQSGSHKFAVSNDFRFTFTEDRRPSTWDQWLWRVLRALGRSGPPGHTPNTAHRCRFTVPIEVNFVEKEAAEPMKSVSGDQIDETMRKTIVTTTRADVYDTYTTPSGKRTCQGGATVAFLTTPVAVAWRVSLRLEDGQELPHNAGQCAQRIRTRADCRGWHVIDMARFQIEEPGTYSGTLILRPDPNCAYEDPAIQSVWDGTLEFPISFTIYSVAQRSRSVQKLVTGP